MNRKQIFSLEEIRALADEVYDIKNIGASIASGTYKTEGMVIVPCSMKTVAAIANGYSDNLLLRAADVVLKRAAEAGACGKRDPVQHHSSAEHAHFVPGGRNYYAAMQTYYNLPETVQDMTDHITGKILDVFGIEFHRFRRWNPGK